MESDSVFRRVAGVIARRIGDEILLVPITRESGDLENLFALNEVGAFVWEAVDEGRSIPELAVRVAEAFEVGPGEAEADVRAFLAELGAAGLVSEEVRA